MATFSPKRRDEVRSHILEAARKDPRVTSAALTGSAARAEEDEWSDIDLVFGVNEEEVGKALEDWTELMYREFDAVHLLDVASRSAIYRVFLLPGSLQVDLAFSPQNEFGATGPSFRLMFGESVEQASMPSQPVRQMIGWGSLYLLHARASIRRGKRWQAEYFIRGLRDYVFALACRRLGKESSHGRGYDELPREALGPLEGSLVHSFESHELTRALSVVTHAFLQEARLADREIVERLQAASLFERAHSD